MEYHIFSSYNRVDATYQLNYVELLNMIEILFFFLENIEEVTSFQVKISSLQYQRTACDILLDVSAMGFWYHNERALSPRDIQTVDWIPSTYDFCHKIVLHYSTFLQFAWAARALFPESEERRISWEGIIQFSWIGFDFNSLFHEVKNICISISIYKK